MAKLSEILQSSEKEISPFYFGVEVDEESFTPPVGLTSIAFMLLQDKDGEIDETLMDVIISYALAGIEITLEIPHDAPEIDAQYYLSVAANAGFSLSLLPPEEESAENRANYITRLTDFADAYFSQANFGYFITPVTSFLEYLFIEQLKDTKGFEAKDPYIRQRFVEPMSEDFANEFKAALRKRIYEIFDGKEGFDNFAKAMIHKIYEQTESNAKDLPIPEEANPEDKEGDAGTPPQT